MNSNFDQLLSFTYVNGSKNTNSGFKTSFKNNIKTKTGTLNKIRYLNPNEIADFNFGRPSIS